MEAAVVSAALKMLGPKIFAFVQGKYELGRDLERDIQYIRKELDMIAAAIEDHERRSWAGDGRVSDELQRIWIQGVRELAYSIEDGIDRYLHDVALGRDPGGGVAAASIRQKGRQLKKISIRNKFAAEIRELKKKSEQISKLRMLYTAGGGQPSASGSSSGVSAAAAASSFLASHTQTPAADLVGMDAPRDEILELMREDEGRPKQLKVISVVGFGGLGKTALARQVYDSVAVGEQYSPRIWVRASDKDAGDVLKEILQKVQVGGGVQGHEEEGSRDVLVERLRFQR